MSKPATSTDLGTPSYGGGWIWSPRIDLSVFGGSALGSLLLVGLNQKLGWSTEPFPEWAWLVLILGVDVAHVYATLFRTYLNVSELKRKPLRYFGLPAALYVAGVALFYAGSGLFWRCLAYLAVWHFVRQQLGWVRVYRACAQARTKIDAWIDEGAIYAATLVPVFVWHTRLNTARFNWFVAGDFVDVAATLAPLLPLAWGVWGVLLGTFALRQLALWHSTRRLELGKVVLVASTAAVWWLGIVGTNSDFDFTATNVLAHGVPYMCLLWMYARAQAKLGARSLSASIAGAGFAGFIGVLWAFGLLEEFGWDRFVYHERSWLFGGSTALQAPLLIFIVPLLALPQVTHYALDGLLWRRSETSADPAQKLALGMAKGSD
ncbi:MAG: hypothetical protein SFV15_26310 [Polyangiaceae bacterium]|nr:hypothetical protein [Polyangiaceae bacterium]